MTVFIRPSLVVLLVLSHLTTACGDSTRWSDVDRARQLASQADPPLPGQPVLHPETSSWLASSGGGPLFICGPGDPEDFLYRGQRRRDGTREGDQLDLIAKLAGTGANSIYLQAVRSHGGDGGPDHNPFVDSQPENGVSPSILDQWERWFAALNDAEVIVHFFFYDDSSEVWSTGDRVSEQEARFIRALVNRFEHLPNIVWLIAEEYEEAYSAERVSALAAEVRAADDHDHIIGVHKLVTLDFEEFAAEPLIEQLAVQWRGGYADVYDGIVQMRTRWEGRKAINMAEIAEHGTGTVARRKNWAAAMAGASAVMVYEMDIASTSESDLQDCGRLRQFLSGVDLAAMRPRPDLSSERLFVLANDDETTRAAYAPHVSASLTLSSLPPGRYRVRWFAPTRGWAGRDSVTHGGGTLQLARPAELRGADIGVVVEAR